MPFLFKIDARIKLICVLLLTVPVFMVDKLPAAACMLIFYIVIRLAAKVLFKGGAGFWKFLILLGAIIILLQTLFGPGSYYIVKPLFPPSFPVFGGMGSLKLEGFLLGLVIICRLAALMLILPVFTETTPPHLISAGLCSMGVNYKPSFIITTAFNLVSFFKDEACLIMDAQKLRGMRSFERGGHDKKGSFLSGVRAYTGLLVPLMLNAMRKAQNSSVAMDSRAFGIYKTRTWIDKPRLKTHDFWIILICLALVIFILIVNYEFTFFYYLLTEKKIDFL